MILSVDLTCLFNHSLYNTLSSTKYMLLSWLAILSSIYPVSTLCHVWINPFLSITVFIYLFLSVHHSLSFNLFFLSIFISPYMYLSISTGLSLFLNCSGKHLDHHDKVDKFWLRHGNAITTQTNKFLRLRIWVPNYRLYVSLSVYHYICLSLYLPVTHLFAHLSIKLLSRQTEFA